MVARTLLLVLWLLKPSLHLWGLYSTSSFMVMGHYHGNGRASNGFLHGLHLDSDGRLSQSDFSLTLDMFGPNENPRSKLQMLSQAELATLLRNIWKQLGKKSPGMSAVPENLKRHYAKLGYVITTRYETWGDADAGYVFRVIQDVVKSNVSVPLEDEPTDGSYWEFNTKTRRVVRSPQDSAISGTNTSNGGSNPPPPPPPPPSNGDS